MNITMLPPEVLEQIFTYIRNDHLLFVALTCKTFYSIIHYSPYLKMATPIEYLYTQEFYKNWSLDILRIKNKTAYYYCLHRQYDIYTRVKYLSIVLYNITGIACCMCSGTAIYGCIFFKTLHCKECVWPVYSSHKQDFINVYCSYTRMFNLSRKGRRHDKLINPPVEYATKKINKDQKLFNQLYPGIF